MDKITGTQTSVSYWQIAKAVMAAFMGIRKKSDLENDAATLKPVHVVRGWDYWRSGICNWCNVISPIGC